MATKLNGQLMLSMILIGLSNIFLKTGISVKSENLSVR